MNTYTFDGQMAYQHSGNAPTYATKSGSRTRLGLLERIDSTVGAAIERKVPDGSGVSPRRVWAKAERSNQEWRRTGHG